MSDSNAAPTLTEDFDTLPPELARAMSEQGFTELTPVQEAVVAADSTARDLQISSKTGSGKTVAVGIAIGRYLAEAAPRERTDSARAPTVLVLTPTRELAAQVRRELGWLLAALSDASVEVVTGGTNVGVERSRLARGPRLVVGTPGRVLDHLESSAFDGSAVELVVLDEADMMLDMGFREELEGILALLPARRRTYLLSATFGGPVAHMATRYQSAPLRIEGSPEGQANEDITHVAHIVDGRHRYAALLNVLLLTAARQSGSDPTRVLIFVRTRADTLELAAKLQQDGIDAEPLSGDLTQVQRTRTLTSFRLGRITTLVATDVAARGLDVPGVQVVVHGDPPMDADTFTHRSGRTGRAGQKGTSIVLVPPRARWRIERVFEQAGVNPSFAPIPTPERVIKEYRRLTRRRLFEQLGTEPTSEHLEYAHKLLDEHEPARVVASLLALATANPPCPPRKLSPPLHPDPAHPPRPAHPRGRPDRGGKRRFGKHR